MTFVISSIDRPIRDNSSTHIWFIPKLQARVVAHNLPNPGRAKADLLTPEELVEIAALAEQMAVMVIHS